MQVSPALFQKLKKSALILGKNALIVVIYGLNFSFKMQFLRVSRTKNGDFSLRGNFFFFSCCSWLFIKVSRFQENSHALKNSWWRAWFDFIFHKYRSICVFIYIAYAQTQVTWTYSLTENVLYMHINATYRLL